MFSEEAMPINTSNQQLHILTGIFYYQILKNISEANAFVILLQNIINLQFPNC